MDMRKKRKFLSLWLVIAVLGILTVSGIVFAFSGGNPKVVIESFSGNWNEAQPVNNLGNVTFGAYEGGNTPNRLNYGYWDTADGYAVDGTKVIDGDGNFLANSGLTKTGNIIISLSASTSAATVNPVSDTIYISNAYVYVTTATTSMGISGDMGISYQIGTSTVAYVNPDATCAATGCTVASAKESSIMRTTATTSVAVNDTFWRKDNLGGFVNALGTFSTTTPEYVKVVSGEYVTCLASTTTAFKGGKIQEAKCIIEYKSIDY